MTAPARRLTIAANNGAVGGGEVMLLAIAEAARDLGWSVEVVAPETPVDLLGQARAAGHTSVGIPGPDRRAYMRNLRAWDRRHREGLLWCNGLVPATATAGRPDRVVHLHQEPRGLQRAARVLANLGSRATIIPSVAMGRDVRHTVVMPNWTTDLPRLHRDTSTGLVLGYLGRLTIDKGVHVLAETVGRLVADGHPVRLVVAGDGRFGSSRDEEVVGGALRAIDAHVTRLGWTDRETFFSGVDLAVFPSVWTEPFGLVAAEAMASGVPFVVTDAGALVEVAGDRHRWVARREDPESLARVIEQALAQPQAERRADLDAGRERWQRLYSPAAGRERLKQVLDDIVGASDDAGSVKGVG